MTVKSTRLVIGSVEQSSKFESARCTTVVGTSAGCSTAAGRQAASKPAVSRTVVDNFAARWIEAELNSLGNLTIRLNRMTVAARSKELPKTERGCTTEWNTSVRALSTEVLERNSLAVAELAAASTTETVRRCVFQNLKELRFAIHFEPTRVTQVERDIRP